MIGPVEDAFVAATSAAATFPTRWPNDQWPDGVVTSDGNMPVDGSGLPAPAIEARAVFGGSETLPVGKDASGKRTHRAEGTVHFYVSVGQGTGRAAINGEIAALIAAFDRATLIDNPSEGERLVTEDPRVDDDIVMYEEGARYTRLVSVPWVYLYKTVQK